MKFRVQWGGVMPDAGARGKLGSGWWDGGNVYGVLRTVR